MVLCKMGYLPKYSHNEHQNFISNNQDVFTRSVHVSIYFDI